MGLKGFDFSKARQANNLDEFELAFEKAGYRPEHIEVPAERTQEFIEKFQVLSLRLTSYDLAKRYKDEIKTKPSEARRHTREIWQKFAADLERNTPGPDISVRLNPELKIRYRQADEKLAEYLREKKGLDPQKTKHRYLQEQYMVSFSFDLNAGKKHEELAFAKPEDISRKIDDFNAKFNQNYWDKLWKYGIDRGNIELATLCIARFDESEMYEYKGKKHLKPRFPQGGEQDITVYELRPEKYRERAKSNLEFPNNPERLKERRIIANLSYFIDRAEDEKWFVKKSATCIDLTTAKVIKGQIVNNGDVLTFLKLKKEAAKRILHDLVDKGEITAENATLDWASKDPTKQLSVELRYAKKDSKQEESDKEAEDRTVYFYENHHGRNFEGLLLDEDKKHAYSTDNIRQNLQTYLDGLLREKAKQHNDRSKHVPTVDKINHLRDALVANMVGVIFHLQKTYPGIIVLEDLDMALIQKHFQQLNLDISSRLERSLYQKFQTMGWVPPHIKDILARREKERKKYKTELREVAEKKRRKTIQKKEQLFLDGKVTKKEFEEYRELQISEEYNTLRNQDPYSNQLGAMVFVDEYRTSGNCPYCRAKWAWGDKVEKEL
ncbi:MAG: hypothetical protein AAF975_06940, partial [Spirochaetota bacterium]